VSNLLKNLLADKAIHSITKFTTLDYPNHLASIFWFAKCNMACPYCYNPQIVREKGFISLEEALCFLESRRGKLDSVVLSGGECTLYPHLEEFTQAIKALGFKIKIDTNGSNPTLIKRLLDTHLVDYIALDYKAPLSKYQEITHYPHVERFEQTLQFLLASTTPFEIRTTLHSDLLSVDDINCILEDLNQKGYQGTYYIQRYLHVAETLGSTTPPIQTFDASKLITHSIPIEFRN